MFNEELESKCLKHLTKIFIVDQNLNKKSLNKTKKFCFASKRNSK